MLKPNTIYCTDALQGLRKLPNESIDMLITSPPYWNLRDYHVTGQIGREKTGREYIEKLLTIFDEAKRVLKKEGTCWVNLGDNYGTNTTNITKGAEGRTRWEKCLLALPERFALGMLDRGWTLRNKIIWHKPNPMPSSVRDRFTNSWEYLYLFTRAKKYYFDLDAIREPHKPQSLQRTKQTWNGHREKNSSWQHMKIGKMCHPQGKNPGDFIRSTGVLSRSTAGLYLNRPLDDYLHPGGKNPGDCWDIPTQAFKEAHFATFPERLVEKPIKTTPQWICQKCGTPRRRITLTNRTRPIRNISSMRAQAKQAGARIAQPTFRWTTRHTTGGWTACNCKAGYKPSLILDIFSGSGTTAVVAARHGRNYLGFELNPDYVKLARQRLRQQSATTTAFN